MWLQERGNQQWRQAVAVFILTMKHSTPQEKGNQNFLAAQRQEHFKFQEDETTYANILGA